MPRMLSALKAQPLAVQGLGTLRPSEAARGAGHRAPVASVDEAACTLCGACHVICPTGAITLGETAVKVNAEACCGCGACVGVCENGAIRLE
jgi:uncharacterized Fe-S center protein